MYMYIIRLYVCMHVYMYKAYHRKKCVRTSRNAFTFFLFSSFPPPSFQAKVLADVHASLLVPQVFFLLAHAVLVGLVTCASLVHSYALSLKRS